MGPVWHLPRSGETCLTARSPQTIRETLRPDFQRQLSFPPPDGPSLNCSWGRPWAPDEASGAAGA
eukprot:5647537-Pyramimonas_sp.AAC.1